MSLIVFVCPETHHIRILHVMKPDMDSNHSTLIRIDWELHRTGHRHNEFIRVKRMNRIRVH